MVFTVTYRQRDGRMADIAIEAESRGDCIAKCNGRGISPIRISAGGTAGDKPKSVTGGKIFAGVCVAAAVGVAAWLLVPTGKTVPKPQPAAERPKSTVKTAPRKEVKPAVAEAPKPKAELPKWKYPVERTNELNEVELRKWRAMHRPPPGYTNTTSRTEAPPKYAIFRHRSENEIAALLTMTPGETIVGTPTYTRKFTEDFLKSLETPIIVSEEDSEEDAELKRAMVETKIELKARMDAGEDLGQILLDTRREYQDLARYKMMLKSEINAISKNPDATIKDVEDFVAAANQLLEQKGIAPLKLSTISRRMLLRKKGTK